MAVNQLQAHYLWIETNPKGTPGKAQKIRVYFGEYTNGTIEKPGGEAFPKESFGLARSKNSRFGCLTQEVQKRN